MATLPIDQAIVRLRENESRVDRFTNGTEAQTWTDSGGNSHPTVAKVIADLNNEALTGPLILRAEQAADDAETARQAAETAAAITHKALTWAALSAITGTAGQTGMVYESDTGTHTDPITSETVPNAGVYLWTAGGTGALRARRMSRTSNGIIMEELAAKAPGSTKGESLDGMPVIVDAKDKPVMIERGEGGLDFIPSAKLARRIASVPGPDTDLTLDGEVLIRDAAGRVVMSISANGLNLVPDSNTKCRMNDSPWWAPADAFAFGKTSDGRRYYHRAVNGLMVRYTEALKTIVYEPSGMATEPQKSRAPKFVAGDGNTFQFHFFTGQSQIGGGTFDYGASPNITETFYALHIADPEPGGYADWTFPVRADEAKPSWLKDFIGVREWDWNRTQSGYGRSLPTAAANGDCLNLRRAEARVLPRANLYVGASAPGDPLSRFTPEAASTWHVWTILTALLDGVKTVKDAGYNIESGWHVMMQGTANRQDALGVYYPQLVAYHGQIESAYASRGFEAPRHIIVQEGGYDAIAGNAAWAVCLDQLRYCQEGNAILATSFYPFRWADQVHPTALEVLRINDTVAIAMAEVESGRGWPTAGPIRHWTSGNDIFIEYDLRQDETLTFHPTGKYGSGKEPAFYGYQAIAVGSTEVSQTEATITAVNRVARNIIKITVANIANVQCVQYAMQRTTPANGDNYSAFRGRMRTNLKWKAKHGGADLHRWLPIHRVYL